MARQAPHPDAPVSEHRKFADEFLRSSEGKAKPKNHPKVESDVPPEFADACRVAEEDHD